MIDIQYPHALPETAVRQIVQTLADKLVERFEVNSRWSGDRLAFQRPGVDGAIELLPGAVRVTAHLGFPFSMMSPVVEDEIRRVLSERLG